MLAPSTQSELLRTLQQKLLGWEADCRPEAAPFSTGCQVLDSVLPGKGLRRGAIVEYLADSGSGATVLALVAAREACREGKALIVVDRQRRFHPPSAANVGIDLANTVFVRPRTQKEERWAMNQSLKCSGVGAVLSWPGQLDARGFRALQLAAEDSEAVGLFIRPVGIRGRPTWARLQLLVEALPTVDSKRRLRIEIVRCRNGQPGKSVELELDDETGSLQQSRVMSSASELAGPAFAIGPAGA